MRQFSQRFFPPIAGSLAVILVWLAIGALRADTYAGSTYVAAMCCGIVLGISATAVWLRWHPGRVLAFVSGIALCVIAIGAMLLGLAFGAPSIPILIAPVFVFVAVMAFSLPPNESSGEPPSKSLERTRDR